MKTPRRAVLLFAAAVGLGAALFALVPKKKIAPRAAASHPAVTKPEAFTETIPGTGVSFRMIRVPGGTFRMGSPDGEPLRDPDEGPVHEVTVSPFWIGETEVSWAEFDAFLRATRAPRKTPGQAAAEGQPDAVTGASPPWGAPDQGWGKGARPAITMSWHAANVYCRWLSEATGKRYRLPTEAEWEYACRGGTSTPYFFSGDARDFSAAVLWNRIVAPDASTMASFVRYRANSASRTGLPDDVDANPFGLRNMPGNVAEFCSDYYAASAYAAGTASIDPQGPGEGQERVIRGGSFRSDAKDVRCAARDHTRTQAWLASDPQMPKSRWWYSDCDDVGFRVVCEI